MNEKIYEMVDSTNEESYFTLGLWPTLEEAIAALNECKEPGELGSDGDHDDVATVEIRERKIGWCGHGKKVHERKWVQVYDEAKDEYGWRLLPNEKDSQ